MFGDRSWEIVCVGAWQSFQSVQGFADGRVLGGLMLVDQICCIED